MVKCFPLHLFRALAASIPACFTTEQSTVNASLFINCILICSIIFIAADEKKKKNQTKNFLNGLSKHNWYSTCHNGQIKFQVNFDLT